ncbi:uncharacterized protein LOC131948118 [Physella acuta]|uniref:uncharacterized protein LOC131948118 n=1 Tax=Physella acuta TaxID=109671 RepID=UPI0027DD3DC8|nr:uncharacterized protein LOC131948118 [Physella acuta]XP_059165628.1 uncharacterized protein LOC131948118 [Physella acuta]XP_059165637.1 uncharacterized protein LOC131948118 [Physella acuta]
MENRERIRRLINNNRMSFIQKMPTLIFIEDFPGLLAYQREKLKRRLDNLGEYEANSDLIDAMVKIDGFERKFIDFCNKREICQSLVELIESQIGRRPSKPRGADYSPAVGGDTTMDISAQPVVVRDGSSGNTTVTVDGSLTAVGANSMAVHGSPPTVSSSTTVSLKDVVGGTVALGGSSKDVVGSTIAVGGSSKDVVGSTVAVDGSSKDVVGSTVALGGSSKDVVGGTVAIGGSSKDVVGSTMALGGSSKAVGGSTMAVAASKDVDVGGSSKDGGGSTVALGGSSKDEDCKTAAGSTVAVGGSPLSVDSRSVSIASRLINVDGITTTGERPDEHYWIHENNSNHSDASVSDNGCYDEASVSGDCNHGDPRAAGGLCERKTADGVGEIKAEARQHHANNTADGVGEIKAEARPGPANNTAEVGGKYPAEGEPSSIPETPFKLTLKCYSNNLDGKIKNTDVNKGVNYVPAQTSESHDSDSDSSFALDTPEIASTFPDNIRKDGAHFIDNLKLSSSNSANTDILKAETKDMVNRIEIDQSTSYLPTLQISELSSESFEHEIELLKVGSLHLARGASNLLAMGNSSPRKELHLTEINQNTAFYHVNFNQAIQCEEDLQNQETSTKDRETNDPLSDETLVKTIVRNPTTVSDIETDEPLHEVTKSIPDHGEPIPKVSKAISNVAGQGTSMEVSQESAHDSASASNTLEESFQDIHLTKTSTDNSNNSHAVVPRDNSINSHAVVPNEQRQHETQSANDTGERLLPSVVGFLIKVYNWSF